MHWVPNLSNSMYPEHYSTLVSELISCCMRVCMIESTRKQDFHWADTQPNQLHVPVREHATDFDDAG